MIDDDDVEYQVPPAGEEVHLPGPTIKPLLTAIALTLIVVGTTTTWVFSIVGGIMFVWVVLKWIGDTRRDIAELPEEH